MTEIVKANSKLNLNSKRGRQEALEIKIAEIDARLKELGVGGTKVYRLKSAIQNPEAHSNTITIGGITDINFALRIYAYYKNIQDNATAFIKKHKISLLGVDIRNINGIPVNDILNDLEIRMLFLTNQVEINKLTQIKAKITPFMNEESRFINALKEVEQLLK